MTAISNARSSETTSSISAIVYLLAAGSIGAAIGLLFGPRSGARFRLPAEWPIKGYREPTGAEMTAKEGSDAGTKIPEANLLSFRLSQSPFERGEVRPYETTLRAARRTAQRGRRSASIV